MEIEDRTLPVKLTIEEKLARGSELAQKLEELANIEMASEETRNNFKAETKRVEGEVVRLHRTVLDGQEYRTVTCEWRLDFYKSIAELVRVDTDEIVLTRPITEEERQQQLFSAAAGVGG